MKHVDWCIEREFKESWSELCGMVRQVRYMVGVFIRDEKKQSDVVMMT